MTVLRAPAGADVARIGFGPHTAAWVLRTSPEDGAAFVLRDTPVLLRLSHPVDPATLRPWTVRVADPDGEVPAEISWTGGGLVVIWRARRLLSPGAEHVLTASGLRNQAGQEIATHFCRFVPCGLAQADLRGP